MNVSLINSPVRLNDLPRVPPIGLAIIANVLRASGNNVRVVDVNADRKLVNNLKEVVAMVNDADIIGVSGMITTYAFQKELARKLRSAYPDKFLVSGGSLATSVPNLVLEKTVFDAVCIGEGETSMLDLVSRLEKGDNETPVPGFWIRRHDGVHKFEARQLVADLDNLPLPGYDLLDMEVYLNNYKWNKDEGRSACIITSRGCPFNCIFCYRIFGKGIRFRSMKSLAVEIAYLKSVFGIKYVAMVDDNATSDKGRLLEICELMKREGLRWGCHGRVDSASEEVFAIMKDSGCNFLGMGIESGSRKILRNMNKRVSKKQIEKAIKLQRKNGFGGNSYIFGGPGENLFTIFETAIFLGRLYEIVPGMFTMTAYPGTLLYEKAVKDGKIGDLEGYLLQLEDADKFLVNFSDIPDAYFEVAKKFQIWLIRFFAFVFHPFRFLHDYRYVITGCVRHLFCLPDHWRFS